MQEGENVGSFVGLAGHGLTLPVSRFFASMRHI